ncbi:carbohydrate ABC transporter permease [Marinicrinis lubricantis]|uniref:Carbohydrate ABC transporter permease n=1 Tax=Marinicrinis lubricantis TaxID=2086470 RepID=A0ABW1IRX0_9BACL
MSKSIRFIPLYFILIVMALIVLYPIIYVFLSSFMTPEEAALYPPKLWPGSMYFGNISDVVDTVPIAAFIMNSFIVSTIVMAGQLITASMAAYAFTYISFVGRNVWFAIFLSTMMVPWEVTIIPNYLTVRAWGWTDSYQGLTVPFFAAAFGVFLLRQYFMQIPKELFEAARMDGCGHARSFLWIVLPLARPALATLAVYVFLNTWNSYLWPLLITNSETMRTVQIGISMLQWEEFMSWNLVLAGVALILLPSLLLLLLGLKQLVRGITAGAVKG